VARRGRRGVRSGFWRRTLRERDRLEDPGLYLRMILKCILHNFNEGITNCSNGLSNKLTSTRQHNKYLLQYIGYMFRPVNRSSSGLHRNKPQVSFRYWDPNIFTVVNIHKADIG